MVGQKARGAALTVMMLTLEMMAMRTATSSTLGFPGQNHEAFPIYLIKRCPANAERDTDGNSLQEHESPFFVGAQGPDWDRKVSGCMFQSVTRCLTTVTRVLIVTDLHKDPRGWYSYQFHFTMRKVGHQEA